MPEVRLIRWGYATDTRRNELYLAAGWRHITVLANADSPAKWQEIDRLGSTDSAPLHTHRDVAPGIYYYHNYRWYTPRRKEQFYKPMDKQFRKGSFTLGDYMDMPDPAK